MVPASLFLTAFDWWLHAVPDPDLEIRGGGGSSRPLDKGRGGLPKTFFRPFGPQFGLKKEGEPGPRAPESATDMFHTTEQGWKPMSRVRGALYSSSLPVSVCHKG